MTHFRACYLLVLGALVAGRGAATRRIVAPNPSAQGWQELFGTEAGRQDLRRLVESEGVTGFKFMINCVTNLFSVCAEADWSQVVSVLRDLNVSVGIEAGMFQGVTPGAPLPNSCDGAQDAADDLAKVQHLLDAGASIDFWSMDSIFQHTYPYDDASGVWKHQSRADCCNFSVAEAVAEGTKYAKAIAEALPGVELGMNEPAPWYWVTSAFAPSNVSQGSADYAMHDRDLAELVPTLQRAMRAEGVELSYVHVDMPFEFSSGEATVDKASNGWFKLIKLGEVVSSCNMRFGKYFNAGLDSDSLFYELALADAQSYRAWAGSLPDDIVLESWFSNPSKLLPGDQEYSFLWDAKRFFQRLQRESLPANSMRQQQWSKAKATVVAVQSKGAGTGAPLEQALDALDSYVGRAAADHADLVLFPEFFLGPIQVGDATFQRASEAARVHGMNLAVGAWVVDTGVQLSGGCPGQQCAKRYTNSILIFRRDGGLVGMYNKTHAAVGSEPPYWPPQELGEGEWWMRWGESYPVFDLDFARIGVQTCYDGYFPEPARAASLQGAELLLWPNGRPGSVEPFLVQSAVSQNLMHVMATNDAMGTGAIITSWPGQGPTCGVDKQGQECYISATLDLLELRHARKQSRQFHQRRADLSAATLGVDWDVPGFYAGLETASGFSGDVHFFI